jgi:hypothetical protein
MEPRRLLRAQDNNGEWRALVSLKPELKAAHGSPGRPGDLVDDGVEPDRPVDLRLESLD